MNHITWDIVDPDAMRVVIMRDGNPVMQISVHEIVESCSRNKILQHVAECDRTPWLTRWQNEKHAGLVDMLTKDYSDV
jgi:hypothetical protein